MILKSTTVNIGLRQQKEKVMAEFASNIALKEYDCPHCGVSKGKVLVRKRINDEC